MQFEYIDSEGDELVISIPGGTINGVSYVIFTTTDGKDVYVPENEVIKLVTFLNGNLNIM